MERTILVLGGGIAGIVAARELRRHLGLRHRIVVVDQNEYHEFPPSYPWVMIGWRQPEILRKPLSLLSKNTIEFRHGRVEAIDVSEGLVRIPGETLRYDYVIVALGGTRKVSAVKGWDEGCYALTSYDGAIASARALSQVSRGRIAVLSPDPSVMFQPLAIEAAFLLESYAARKGLRDLRIELVVPHAAIAHPGLHPAEQALRRMLAERQIHVRSSAAVSSVEKDRGVTFEDGTSAEYDLIVGVPEVSPPPLFAQAGLADESGWIPVDPQELRTHDPRCFVIGDAAGVTLDNGSRLPRLGSLASSQGEAVARILAAELLDRPRAKGFDGVGYCFVETGNGRAGYVFADFYASPSPQVTWHEPNVTYHWGKVVFEKYWMWRWL